MPYCSGSRAAQSEALNHTGKRLSSTDRVCRCVRSRSVAEACRRDTFRANKSGWVIFESYKISGLGLCSDGVLFPGTTFARGAEVSALASIPRSFSRYCTVICCWSCALVRGRAEHQDRASNVLADPWSAHRAKQTLHSLIGPKPSAHSACVRLTRSTDSRRARRREHVRKRVLT